MEFNFQLRDALGEAVAARKTAKAKKLAKLQAHQAGMPDPKDFVAALEWNYPGHKSRSRKLKK